MDAYKLRDEMYERLTKEFEATKVEIRPYSPKKYAINESRAVNVCIPELKPEKSIVCGMEIQINRGPYKIWFKTHPEWEEITKCEIAEWATNNPGIGSGNGFYVSSLDTLINEVKAYLQRYYPDYICR